MMGIFGVHVPCERHSASSFILQKGCYEAYIRHEAFYLGMQAQVVSKVAFVVLSPATLPRLEIVEIYKLSGGR